MGIDVVAILAAILNIVLFSCLSGVVCRYILQVYHPSGSVKRCAYTDVLVLNTNTAMYHSDLYQPSTTLHGRDF
jgi:uncharacterized membrane protein (DUF373 family)